VDAVLNGSIQKAKFVQDPVFGVYIPAEVEGVPSEILFPRDTWKDKDAFDATALKLAKAFQENFKQYEKVGYTQYSAYGPQVTA
jgi:phosphoenolpyruvate carboxykinase (ATP)